MYPAPSHQPTIPSGIKVAVGDCSVTERRRWHPPYQAGKTTCACKNTTNIKKTNARRWVCQAMVPYGLATRLLVALGLMAL